MECLRTGMVTGDQIKLSSIVPSGTLVAFSQETHSNSTKVSQNDLVKVS